MLSVLHILQTDMYFFNPTYDSNNRFSDFMNYSVTINVKKLEQSPLETVQDAHLEDISLLFFITARLGEEGNVS